MADSVVPVDNVPDDGAAAAQPDAPEPGKESASQVPQAADGEGSTSVDQVTAAMSMNGISMQQGRLKFDLDKLPPGLSSTLAAFDMDASGVVDGEELRDAAAAWKRSQQLGQILKIVVGVLLGLLVLLLGANMALTYAAVELSKETHVKEGSTKLTNNNGDVVQTASSDLTVTSQGAILARDAPGSDSSARRLALTDGEAHSPSGRLASALGVRRQYQKRELSSTMPDKYFKELEWFELESDMGATVSLRISSIVRVPRNGAACGSVLVLVTSVGRVILDDVELTFDHEVGQLFSEAGFAVEESEASGTGTNVLESLAGATNGGRRLSGTVSIVGFFNLIDDVEWTCTTVTKPSMAKTFFASSSIYLPCLPDSRASEDPCRVAIGGKEYSGPGVVQYQDAMYAKNSRSIVVNATDQFLVDRSPGFPGTVTVHHAKDGFTFSWQQDHTGFLSHCQVVEGMMPMDIPDDYLFHYVGEVGDMRRFRLSYQPVESGGKRGKWKHLDYFDDIGTQVPRLLLSENKYIEMDTYIVGDDIPQFEALGITVPSLDELESCMAQTHAIAHPAANRFNSAFERRMHPENMTEYSVQYEEFATNATHVLGVARNEYPDDDLDSIASLWDWGAQYPPEMGGAAATDGSSVQYYVKSPDSDYQEWYQTVVDAEVELRGAGYYGNSTNARELGQQRLASMSAPARRALQQRTKTNGRTLNFGIVSVTLDIYTPIFGFNIELSRVTISFEYELDRSTGQGKFNIYAEGCAYEVLCVTGGTTFDRLRSLHKHVHFYVSIAIKLTNKLDEFDDLPGFILDPIKAVLSFFDRKLADLTIDWYNHVFENPGGWNNWHLAYRDVFFIKLIGYFHPHCCGGTVEKAVRLKITLSGLYVRQAIAYGAWNGRTDGFFVDVGEYGIWAGVDFQYFNIFDWPWNWDFKTAFHIKLFHFDIEDNRKRKEWGNMGRINDHVRNPIDDSWGPKLVRWG